MNYNPTRAVQETWFFWLFFLALGFMAGRYPEASESSQLNSLIGPRIIAQSGCGRLGVESVPRPFPRGLIFPRHDGLLSLSLSSAEW
jgi:hypothetical protein